MTPDERETQRRAARAALRALQSDWPGEADSSHASSEEPSEGDVAAMRETIEALRSWQRSLADLPQVPLPAKTVRVAEPASVLPAGSWRRQVAMLAAAALVFLACGLWFAQSRIQMAQVQAPQEKGPHVAAPPKGQGGTEGGLDGGPGNVEGSVGLPPRTGSVERGPNDKTGGPSLGGGGIGTAGPPAVPLADSAKWLAEAPLPPVLGKGSIGGGTTDKGSFGGKENFPPGSVQHPPRGGKPGGVEGGSTDVLDAGQQFVAAAKLDFACRAPITLPGNWTFREGKAINASRVQLTYVQGTKVLSVLLWKSPGENEGPLERTFDKDRKMTVVRRSAVGVAFEGDYPRAEAGRTARLFAPAR